jgi:hypothetical protein
MRARELFTAEGRNDGGLEYESEVLKAMAAAQVPGLEWQADTSAGFSSHGEGDIEATYNGNKFNIEVKASINDQMGGGSVAFDGNSWRPSAKLEAGTEPDDLALILKAAEGAEPALAAYLEELKTKEPQEFHARNTGIPFVAEVGAREELKASGHHKALNQIVTLDQRYIVGLYNKKNVFYIQVGGAGLFALGSDPLGLGVPAFEGSVNVEMRIGFAGTKVKIPGRDDTTARRAEYRCIARMKTKSKSPFSLDDPDSIRTLFDK